MLVANEVDIGEAFSYIRPRFVAVHSFANSGGALSLVYKDMAKQEVNIEAPHVLKAVPTSADKCCKAEHVLEVWEQAVTARDHTNIGKRAEASDILHNKAMRLYHEEGNTKDDWNVAHTRALAAQKMAAPAACKNVYTAMGEICRCCSRRSKKRGVS